MDIAWSSRKPTFTRLFNSKTAEQIRTGENEQRICKDGILISYLSDHDPPELNVPGPPSSLDSGDNGSEKESVHL